MEQQGDAGIPNQSPPQGHDADGTKGWGGVPQFARVSWCAEAVQPGQRGSPRLQALPMHMLFWAHLPILLPPEGLSKRRAEIIRWR